MSEKAAQWALLAGRENTTVGQRLLLVTMALNYADDSGVGRVRIEEWEQLLLIPGMTLRSHLNLLRKKGLVLIDVYDIGREAFILRSPFPKEDHVDPRAPMEPVDASSRWHSLQAYPRPEVVF